jgi:hypothetical protein
MLKTRGLILAKIETTYGTDPTPTAAANAILCEIPEIEIIQQSLERKNIKSYMGGLARVNIGQGVKISFKTELKGSGTAGTAPEIGPLFRACNYTETLVALTSAAYAPNSSVTDSESVTIWVWVHNLLHKIVGCRGTFVIDLKAGEYGTVSWEMTGIYAGAIDAPVQSGTFNATVPARFVSAAFAIDSYAAIIENLKINAGNDIARRASANASTGMLSYFVKERNVTGEIDPEAPALGAGSILTLASAPTAAGTGYTVGDVLTITTGGTGGTARVLTITGGGGTGPVGTVELVTAGANYTTGTGKATSGGTGSSCTLNITALTPTPKDFWAMWSNNTPVAMTATVGATGGNICTITAPKVQPTEMKYGERESLLTYALPFVCTPNAGNDELVLTFT